MTIGALSRRTGVPVKALREYEDLGLIYTVGRSAGNYRLFDEEALWCRRDRYPAGTGVDVGRDQQIRAQIDLFGVGHAAPWQTAARAHNGGYRASSDHRIVQHTGTCATRSEHRGWTSELTNDRRCAGRL
jgi:hypothetical protein